MNIYAAFLSLKMLAETLGADAEAELMALHIKQFASGDKDIDKQVKDAEKELLTLAEQANAGEMDKDTFRAEYLALLLLLLANAAKDAAGVDDLAQVAGLETAIAEMYGTAAENIDKLADDIYNGRYIAHERDILPNPLEGTQGMPAQTAQEGLRKLINRIALWGVAIAAAVNLGRLFSADKLRWQYGPTEHCTDCLRLDGQVHTREAWVMSGWRPQGRMLECGGWNCQCRLIAVDPSTPDRGNF